MARPKAAPTTRSCITSRSRKAAHICRKHVPPLGAATTLAACPLAASVAKCAVCAHRAHLMQYGIEGAHHAVRPPGQRVRPPGQRVCPPGQRVRPEDGGGRGAASALCDACGGGAPPLKKTPPVCPRVPCPRAPCRCVTAGAPLTASSVHETAKKQPLHRHPDHRDTRSSRIAAAGVCGDLEQYPVDGTRSELLQ